MDIVFDSKSHRRVFFAATILLFLGLVAIRHYLSPPADMPPSALLQLGIASVDNIISGFFASIFVGATIYFFRPRRHDVQTVRQLPAGEIVPAFERALKNAPIWMFKGNRGRYLRSKVLPYFGSRHGSFVVEGILMNPFNDSLCRKFAEHKNTDIANDEGNGWNVDRVQADIIATLAVCAWYMRRPNLKINIYSVDIFDPIRFDSNSHTAFLTVENKREPCMEFNETHFFHQWIHDQFAVAKLHATQLPLLKINRESLEKIDRSDIVRLCQSISNTVPSPTVLDAAVEITRKNPNPYG